ncbi:hypothetical protein [Haloarcula sp. JP-L23]|uniref:hypothetical protein n=1 Tax=Haloarcula sp. JP-L23 TaxID=2716717 RepID=UPI00140F4B82|nr:hypothetical protein G9465_22990 [Haloarcula sp. JP-L23]
MCEETAEIYSRAAASETSASEAVEDLRELAEEVDWDVERMLADSERPERSEHS